MRVRLLALLTGFVVLAACQPTVRLEAPDRPIEINLNVHIDQEVRVRVDRDADRAIRENPALFGLPSGRRP
ncbi:MAG: YnbE family lipoprotein [Alphaproteobacteria bacterium]|nr:YnbE family lipoprotein [Alphaproteobacteria bacterium]